MSDKTWTATDLQLGKLAILKTGDNLHIERRYQFLDSNDDALDQIAGGRVVQDILWADIPTDIKAALQAIDVWTKDQALEQEGMLD